MAKREKSLRELEKKWYEKLKRSGFEDIENTSLPDRPLKEWHHYKFTTDNSIARQTERIDYNRRIDDLINSPEWRDVCRIISKHGNNKLSQKSIHLVAEFHREGKTEREIAFLLKCSKKCIHIVISKIKEWMKIF